MSTTITITPGQVPGIYRRETAKFRAAIEKAARSAARRLKVHLVARTNELGITDQGTYRAGFKVDDKTVYNDAPHAGIVELGARPHPVSREGIEAIAAWVRRKLRIPPATEGGRRRKYTQDQAMSIAYAIANKIREVGQAPRYVMRDALPMAGVFYGEELRRFLR